MPFAPPLLKWRNCLKKEGRGRWNLVANCSLLNYVTLWDYLAEDRASSSTRWIDILSEMWKRAQNSHSDKKSTRRSNLRCPTLMSFQPLFCGLLLPLVETTPHFANMLSSFGLRGNLHGTTQFLELVTRPIRYLTMPRLYNKKPRWTKSSSLNGLPNETCRASLLTSNRKKDRPHHASTTVVGRNT